jgi:hypothetical protein
MPEGRLAGRRSPSVARWYMFSAMYWPLFGGFVAFVLFAVLMGWIMDPSRRGTDRDRD